jgi:hypothetical protein
VGSGTPLKCSVYDQQINARYFIVGSPHDILRILRSSQITVKVSPMVTIPGWFIERKRPNGMPVLNPKQVKGYLDGKKESVLSETMIKRICHQVEQRCRDVDLWNWY